MIALPTSFCIAQDSPALRPLLPLQINLDLPTPPSPQERRPRTSNDRRRHHSSYELPNSRPPPRRQNQKQPRRHHCDDRVKEEEQVRRPAVGHGVQWDADDAPRDVQDRGVSSEGELV